MNTPVTTRNTPSQSPERSGLPARDSAIATAVAQSRDPEKGVDGGSKELDETTTEQRPAPAPPSKSRRRARRRRLLSKLNPTLTLVNNGSVARDHLASERTFLAYVRTSVAFASMGVALVQLLQLATTMSDAKSATLRRYGIPVGALTILLGLLTLLIGLVRYFTVQKALVDGSITLARYIIIFLGFVFAVVVIVIFGVLVGLD